MTELTVTPGVGQTVFCLPYVYLGYQQITSVNSSLSSGTALTVPATATHALISIETQSVRYLEGGINPTVSYGMPMEPGGVPLLYQGGAAGLAGLRFIEMGSGAVINISYYK